MAVIVRNRVAAISNKRLINAVIALHAGLLGYSVICKTFEITIQLSDSLVCPVGRLYGRMDLVHHAEGQTC